jgi:hypothetical protein
MSAESVIALANCATTPLLQKTTREAIHSIHIPQTNSQIGTLGGADVTRHTSIKARPVSTSLIISRAVPAYKSSHWPTTQLIISYVY